MGEPGKLRGDKKDGSVCVLCLRTGSTEAASNDDQPGPADYEEWYLVELRDVLEVEKAELLVSDARRKLLDIHEGLILEMVLRRGPYWEAINRLRARWRIAPTVGVPPAESLRVWPPPNGEQPPLERWGTELRSVVDRFIPRRFGDVGGQQFVLKCALYDVPRDDVLAFTAACGAVGPMAVAKVAHSDNTSEALVMLEAPIERVRDADKVEVAWRGYYENLIRELGERHLEPLGLDVRELLREVTGRVPQLRDKLREQLRELENGARQYISVDAYTTREDVINAFRIVAAEKNVRPNAGRSKRSGLVAVQCAILCDECGWTHRQIAERYEGRSDENLVRRVKDRVRLGREIIKSS